MNFKASFFSLVSAALFLGTSTAANAHTYATLPLNKAAGVLPYKHVLAALPLSSKINPSLYRIPGLSGSSSAFVFRNKAIVNGGFNSGFNSAVSGKVFGGQITNAGLTGQIYESFAGGNPYERFGQYNLYFGSNPLNLNGGAYNGGIAPSSLVNSISFAGGSSGGATSLARSLSVRGIAGYHLSGSGLAEQKQINALANGAGTAGFKYGNAQFNSPIVGGEFYGTDYNQLVAGGLSYRANAEFIYAFGNSALNVPGTGLSTVNVAGLSNYIQLANGKVFTYSSGLLQGTGYYAGTGNYVN